MITQLTPEQEAQIAVYYDRYLDIGLSTKRSKRADAESAITELYRLSGNKPPVFVWSDSPFSGHVMALTLHKLRDQLRDQLGDQLRDQLGGQLGGQLGDQLRDQLGGQLWGQYEAYWLAFYSYIVEQLAVKCDELVALKLAQWQKVAQTGWWLPYENVCFVSERHNVLNFDGQSRLHCANGLAIGYPDDWGVYAWHGVRVPEYVIMRPDEITSDKIMQEQNAEIARVMLERYGQDNFIRDGGFAKVQSDKYGDLYRVEFQNNDEPIVAIHVQDASTDRDYFLYVPPHIRTAHEGVAWTFGYDNASDYKPDKQT